MKSIMKCLAAVCVLALSVVLVAGCSSQASSSASSSSGSASASASASASSAASQASQDDLIKELEAIAGSKESKSATINIDGIISIDTAAMTKALSNSSESSAASTSAESASASASDATDVPFTMVIKADNSQDLFKMYMSMDSMGYPFELYIAGDNVAVVMAGQTYGGTLQDLEALGMSQYSSLEGAMSSAGAAASFDQYKDAIESITKKEASGETVYTVVLDVSKIGNAQVSSSLAQGGVTGDLATMTVTYVVGADGQLTSSTMEMGSAGFAMVTTAKLSDLDSTVVPDAPEATMSLSDLANLMNSADETTSSSDASKAA